MASAKNRGFTLLEVLIAVAVLAVTLVAFIAASTRHADNARYIQDKTLALWVARNHMVELALVEPWPEEGDDEAIVKMAGREWQWRSEIATSPDPRVRRAEVSVYPVVDGKTPADDAQPLVRLDGFFSPTDNSASGEIDPAALEKLQSQGLIQ